MARRRGRRRGGGGTAAPARLPVGLPRLDANSLSCVADFCSLQDCCALRHRISKRTSQQLASADESEVFARARVLRRVALWWHATTEHFVARTKNWTSAPDSEVKEFCWRRSLVNGKERTTLARQLHTLLRARRTRTLRLGGLRDYYYFIVDASRLIENLAQTSYTPQAPWSSYSRGPFFDRISLAEYDRKVFVEICGWDFTTGRESEREKLKIDMQKSYVRCFSHQQFSDFPVSYTHLTLPTKA